MPKHTAVVRSSFGGVIAVSFIIPCTVGNVIIRSTVSPSSGVGCVVMVRVSEGDGRG
jgi:hypothetical protein